MRPDLHHVFAAFTIRGSKSRYDQFTERRMSAHLGIQIASHILTRSTIQTAVVMASGLGTQQGNAGKRYRHAACDLQLGALCIESPLVNMQSIELHEIKSGETHKKRYTKRFEDLCESHEAFFKGRDDLRVDLVLTPIDGARALQDGESGSLSVAAAAPSGTDQNPAFGDPHKEATGYLVIAVGPDQAKNLNSEELKLTIGAKSLTELHGKFELLLQILKQVSIEVHHALGVMFDPYQDFMPLQSDEMQSLRHLHGSSVAAALAAFCGKLPCTVFFSRLPQLQQCSIAALGLHGRLYAIPLREKKVHRKRKPESMNGQTEKPNYDYVDVLPGIFEAKHFVNSPDAILCCTSISEICVLDRVRFESPTTADSNTLIVRLGDRTARQTDVVRLDVSMRGPLGKEIQGLELIKAYRRYLLKSKKSARLRDEFEDKKTSRRIAL